MDRRRGNERRSTLDRRGRKSLSAVESPGEHLRNALQLLAVVQDAEDLSTQLEADLSAALQRVRRALHMLERDRMVEPTPPKRERSA